MIKEMGFDFNIIIISFTLSGFKPEKSNKGKNFNISLMEIEKFKYESENGKKDWIYKKRYNESHSLNEFLIKNKKTLRMRIARKPLFIYDGILLLFYIYLICHNHLKTRIQRRLTF
ncbi:hypothetical protein [Photorhabdus khanii]|uniref:Uncharacterized protein n=1 Tax=Photorhabdus khanii subsp. guanajuatensis TaxID=2100166 RepID=A0A4R4J381_9GAMM|nr:hypothetical protein [Photorhabdus khanii]TDB47940.1 hypothetical protein C5467_19885 [Photorhabdus khanii subsp. guanajuatensis]